MGELADAVGVDVRKRELRKRFRALRMGLQERDRAAADAAIEANVCDLDAFAEAEVVLTYLDVGSEVRTHGIIERAWTEGKVVALPRCVLGTREMCWYRVCSYDGLVRSSFGVWEPVPFAKNELIMGTGERMIALVPGLAFDAAGYRLGYGGGFYDTFLAGFDGVSVGLCREVQMVESLRALGVVDAHDLPVQIVVTDERAIDTRE